MFLLKNRLQKVNVFRRRSRKISNLRVTGLCEGNLPVTGEFRAQKPVTREMFPSDDVIMCYYLQSITDASIYGSGLGMVRLDKTLTLSKWSSSANPVAIQCAWNLDPGVHWNVTGEIIVGSQCASNGLPVVFQWLSSGLPVCSNYAN